MKLRFVATILMIAFVVAFSASASATTGAIYTSLGDGTIVNQNLYDSKPLVFLNGGPQNEHAAGLSPDGEYYFQVTDPSGAVLLSTDNVECRKVMVTGGVIAGAPSHAPLAACAAGVYHANGAFNSANGSTPVQLIPFNDTPNHGGEYKVWLSTVSTFDNSTNKTDNFKVKKTDPAYISVCKYSDLNGNGVQDDGEPFLAHWVISAKGVDGDAGNGVQQSTNDFGCTTFSYSGFTTSHQSQAITLTEVQQDGWIQTGPLDGSGNVITIQSFNLNPADALNASFGNNTQDPCLANPGSCGAGGGSVLSVTKTAFPSYDKKYVWSIAKNVDKTQINSSSTSATFNYTVTVTHDAGTASNWQLHGTIEVANIGTVDANNVTVTDSDSHCVVTGGTGISIPQGTHADLEYACSYDAQPNAFTNTASALADDGGNASGDASVDFANATVTAIDDSITVSDTLGGSLGTVTAADASPKDLTYSYTVTAPAGSCNTVGNTATFTTNTTSTTGSDSKSVKLCVGANLTMSKTASASFNSNIVKSGPASPVENNGSSTLNYSVVVTESGWNVGGNITVNNPNDWEAVSVNLSDALSDLGGSCVIAGGSPQNVPASSSISPAYSCSFASAPAASGTNTAGASWDSAAYFTPGSSASGTASYAFGSLTVTDAFNRTLTPKTLGTISVPTASTTFSDSYTVTPRGGTCVAYPNTATITQTGQQSSWSVTVCNKNTGALTMGFWQNKNGQGIISSGLANTGVCRSGTWLRGFNPFQDLSATASCAQVATYVYNLVKAANSSGTSMNPMLKAQMMATALDVYFSDAALGGNRIGAPGAIGGVNIDLTKVCKMIDGSGGGSCSGAYQNVSSAFGGASSMTVYNMLLWQNNVSNAGGSVWYGQVKATQEMAKNAFDAINNQVAVLAP